MMLTDFLLARIAEDEEASRSFTYNWSDAQESLRRRFLADCEAKRLIVGWLADALALRDAAAADPDQAWTGHQHLNAMALAAQALALSYADHEDYREEWKP